MMSMGAEQSGTVFVEIKQIRGILPVRAADCLNVCPSETEIWATEGELVSCCHS